MWRGGSKYKKLFRNTEATWRNQNFTHISSVQLLLSFPIHHLIYSIDKTYWSCYGFCSTGSGSALVPLPAPHIHFMVEPAFIVMEPAPKVDPAQVWSWLINKRAMVLYIWIQRPKYLHSHVHIHYMVWAFLASSEATTSSKQPRRPNLTWDFESVTSITYLSMCILLK